MGAMTLTEYAKGSQSDLVKGVIATFVGSSPVLGRLAFRDVAGGALQYQIEETLPGIAFRAINGVKPSLATGTTRTWPRAMPFAFNRASNWW